MSRLLIVAKLAMSRPREESPLTVTAKELPIPQVGFIPFYLTLSYMLTQTSTIVMLSVN